MHDQLINTPTLELDAITNDALNQATVDIVVFIVLPSLSPLQFTPSTNPLCLLTVFSALSKPGFGTCRYELIGKFWGPKKTRISKNTLFLTHEF